MNLSEIEHEESTHLDMYAVSTLGYMIQAKIPDNELALYCIRMSIEESVLVAMKSHFRKCE